MAGARVGGCRWRVGVGRWGGCNMRCADVGGECSSAGKASGRR